MYIDYGTVSRAPIKGLCFLYEEFAKVPTQAIRCRLANVVPPVEGAPWSTESSKYFRKLLLNKTLKATVIKVNWEVSNTLHACFPSIMNLNNYYTKNFSFKLSKNLVISLDFKRFVTIDPGLIIRDQGSLQCDLNS